MSVMVITGGTAGAGKATALRFARAGYHVALIARDETGLQETQQACERFGVKTLAISADVADAGAVQRAAAEVEATLGAIDVWINNAMTTVLAPFRQMSDDEFRRVTEVTYLGYVNGTRAALEVMTPRDRGDYSGWIGAGLALDPPAVGLLRRESGDPRLHRCRAHRANA
jgi:NAD(P)-dependent dehydrogenase (short-subunit alcohol dehydrogenase family)